MPNPVDAKRARRKVVFVHDHVFEAHPDGTIHSSGQLPYTILRRYLRHFETMTVVARQRPAADVRGRSPASGPGVEFRWLPPDLYRRPTPTVVVKAKEVLEEAIHEASAVIVRVPSLAGPWGAMVASRRSVPWAVEVVGCAYDALRWHGSILKRATAWPFSWATRFLVRRAGHALYVTEEFLQRRYPCEGVTGVASNVEVSVLSEDRLPDVCERVSRRSGGPMRVGLIASLQTRYKGIESLLRALAALDGSRESVSVEVAGGGDPAPWLDMAARLGVRDQIEFIGLLPHGEEVWSWLDTLHLYVQPSLTEGLPRGLIEAMSRGLPCLGSRVGGIPELLRADFLHEPGDATGLARLLRRALDEPAWCVSAALDNHRRARSFDRRRLDERRAAFWSRFVEDVRFKGSPSQAFELPTRKRDPSVE